MKSITIRKCVNNKLYYITLQKLNKKYNINYELEHLSFNIQQKFGIQLPAEKAIKTFWFYRHELNFKTHSSFDSKNKN